LNGLNIARDFVLAVIQSDVILSRVFCGEGPAQPAGGTGAVKEFKGPSRQRTPLRMTP